MRPRGVVKDDLGSPSCLDILFFAPTLMWCEEQTKLNQRDPECELMWRGRGSFLCVGGLGEGEVLI